MRRVKSIGTATLFSPSPSKDPKIVTSSGPQRPKSLQLPNPAANTQRPLSTNFHTGESLKTVTMGTQTSTCSRLDLNLKPKTSHPPSSRHNKELTALLAKKSFKRHKKKSLAKGTTTEAVASSKPVAKGSDSTHSKVLMSWERDITLGAMATRAPVLYALEKIPDRLAEVEGPWMAKAKLIWTYWKRVLPSERDKYTERAKQNRLREKEAETSRKLKQHFASGIGTLLHQTPCYPSASKPPMQSTTPPGGTIGHTPVEIRVIIPSQHSQSESAKSEQTGSNSQTVPIYKGMGVRDGKMVVSPTSQFAKHVSLPTSMVASESSVSIEEDTKTEDLCSAVDREIETLEETLAGSPPHSPTLQQRPPPYVPLNKQPYLQLPSPPMSTGSPQKSIKGNATSLQSSTKWNATSTQTSIKGNATSTQTSIKGNATSTQTSIKGNATSPQASIKGNATSPQSSIKGNATSPQASIKGNVISPQASIKGKATSPQSSIKGNATSPQASIKGKATSPQASIKGDSTSSKIQSPPETIPEATSAGIAVLPTPSQITSFCTNLGPTIPLQASPFSPISGGSPFTFVIYSPSLPTNITGESNVVSTSKPSSDQYSITSAANHSANTTGLPVTSYSGLPVTTTTGLSKATPPVLPMISNPRLPVTTTSGLSKTISPGLPKTSTSGLPLTSKYETTTLSSQEPIISSLQKHSKSSQKMTASASTSGGNKEGISQPGKPTQRRRNPKKHSTTGDATVNPSNRTGLNNVVGGIGQNALGDKNATAGKKDKVEDTSQNAPNGKRTDPKNLQKEQVESTSQNAASTAHCGASAGKSSNPVQGSRSFGHVDRLSILSAIHAKIYPQSQSTTPTSGFATTSVPSAGVTNSTLPTANFKSPPNITFKPSKNKSSPPMSVTADIFDGETSPLYELLNVPPVTTKRTQRGPRSITDSSAAKPPRSKTQRRETSQEFTAATANALRMSQMTAVPQSTGLLGVVKPETEPALAAQSTHVLSGFTNPNIVSLLPFASGDLSSFLPQNAATPPIQLPFQRFLSYPHLSQQHLFAANSEMPHFLEGSVYATPMPHQIAASPTSLHTQAQIAASPASLHTQVQMPTCQIPSYPTSVTNASPLQSSSKFNASADQQNDRHAESSTQAQPNSISMPHASPSQQQPAISGIPSRPSSLYNKAERGGASVQSQVTTATELSAPATLGLFQSQYQGRNPTSMAANALATEKSFVQDAVSHQRALLGSHASFLPSTNTTLPYSSLSLPSTLTCSPSTATTHHNNYHSMAIASNMQVASLVSNKMDEVQGLNLGGGKPVIKSEKMLASDEKKPETSLKNDSSAKKSRKRSSIRGSSSSVPLVAQSPVEQIPHQLTPLSPEGKFFSPGPFVVSPAESYQEVFKQEIISNQMVGTSITPAGEKNGDQPVLRGNPPFGDTNQREIERLYLQNMAILEQQTRYTKMLEQKLMQMEQECNKQAKKSTKVEVYKRFLGFVVEPRCEGDIPVNIPGYSEQASEGIEFSDSDKPVLKSDFDIYASFVP